MTEEIYAGDAESAAAQPERTFTQSEVDALIAKRLDRERKKYPAEEELAAFRDWRENQTEQRNLLETLTKERDQAKSELERLRRENFLLGKGVAAEDADYYAYKIGKLATDGVDFEQAAEKFLAERQEARRYRVETGAYLGGGRTASANDAMNELLRGARNN